MIPEAERPVFKLGNGHISFFRSFCRSHTAFFDQVGKRPQSAFCPAFLAFSLAKEFKLLFIIEISKHEFCHLPVGKIFSQHILILTNPNCFFNRFHGSAMDLRLFIKNTAEGNILIDNVALLPVIKDLCPDIDKRAFRINPKHISCQANLLWLAAAVAFFDSIVEDDMGKCK